MGDHNTAHHEMAWRTRNVGWRIDAVWVTRELMPHVKEAFILKDVTGSDHCPVGITLAV